ncbi:MAG: zinc ABC transporter substrate-binding protein [Deltaproteobacteria bacterium]|nr:zinc ABC transporter substrate-binding protein [Deltaproteobacteria bacterium]
MKKIILFLFCILFFSSPSFAKLKVVTTTPDLANLAQEVGKEFIEVKSIARGDQDYHFLEPKPSYIVQASQADLLISVGLELEVGWLPVLLTQSRNPKIQTSEKGFLDASQNIPVMEIPTARVDRSMGDVHPLGNPHYWLNPNNGILIAQAIAQRLSELDSAHASDYNQNFLNFKNQLSAKIANWQKQLANLKGKKIITQHKSFSYFTDWTGLQVSGFVEPKPGIPPNPGHLLELIALIQKEKVPLIVTENYYDTKAAQELSQKTGSKLLILPTSVGGEANIKNYSDLFENLISKINEALK